MWKVWNVVNLVVNLNVRGLTLLQTLLFRFVSDSIFIFRSVALASP